MYTKTDLVNAIEAIGIKADDTLLVHSSMKSIGRVEGGAETVLDAFIEYMKPGLLIFPTHTWSKINEDNPVYNPKTEPSCVGILTNLFLKRPGVIRSLHPTHSVAALGKDAEDYVGGEEQSNTPFPRNGCWRRLYDRKAKILFLGCSLKRNTFLHGVEEWNHIPARLTDKRCNLKIEMADGKVIDHPMYCVIPDYDVSINFDKMEPAFLYKGIAKKGQIGDAACILGDAVGMADLTSSFLTGNPDLFGNDAPVPAEWYIENGQD